MEDVKKIEAFLSVDTDSGYGYGNGNGYGDGDDYGYGGGFGSGDDYGFGYGYGSGYSSGFGSGDGSGFGSGSGSGSGSGDGYGDGIKTINGQTVYLVDGVQTVIEKVRGNCAKGAILRSDLTLEKCWIVKSEKRFAHGATLKAARDALLEKLFDDMSEDERIAEFVKTHKSDKVYPDKDFFDWHHRLTGSCEMGRMAFAKDRGLEDLNGSRTVKEFIALCENAYGGSIIKKLKEFYK